MKRAYLSIVLGLFLFSTSGLVTAEPVVETIPYTKKTSLRPHQTYALKFSLWDAQTEGNEVWSEEKGQ
jgi:hypothetical protein